VIAAGDGYAVWQGLLVLAGACIAIPWAFAIAWGFFKGFVLGGTERDGD
jgi:hypothetical protein